MPDAFDAILLVSFGGPEGPDDVWPFLERVADERDIPPERLTEVADRADVRAVQALPPDVVSGKFAVEPLLPEYVDVVAPLPDDGDVPSR